MCVCVCVVGGGGCKRDVFINPFMISFYPSYRMESEEEMFLAEERLSYLIQQSRQLFLKNR